MPIKIIPIQKNNAAANDTAAAAMASPKLEAVISRLKLNRTINAFNPFFEKAINNIVIEKISIMTPAMVFKISTLFISNNHTFFNLKL